MIYYRDKKTREIKDFGFLPVRLFEHFDLDGGRFLKILLPEKDYYLRRGLQTEKSEILPYPPVASLEISSGLWIVLEGFKELIDWHLCATFAEAREYFKGA